MPRFRRQQAIAAPADFVFAWHESPGAFERLAPPWESAQVVERTGGIRDGDRLIMQMGAGPLRMRWIAEHRNYRAEHSFQDVQVSGPFAKWEHTHDIEPTSAQASTLTDDIDYRLPLSAIANLVAGSFTTRRLERMFRYRHLVTEQDIRVHWRHRGVGRMKIAVSGASGLLGGALMPFLTTGGHQVLPLVRNDADNGIYWDPKRGEIEADKLEGCDAVVHLAGENISEGRWTDAKKKRIFDSRVGGTELIAETLAKLENPPKVLVCASAIGYYGDRASEPMTEDSTVGTGFLADVVQQWEEAADAARDAGIRVVHLRLGVILAGDGGLVGKLLLPFRMGAGGVIGSGEQYMSWIAIDDAIGIIHHAIVDESLQGPVNAVAPNPVTNLEFTKTMGTVLSRPTILPLPAFAARLAFGEMGDELMLSSTRVIPERLESAGYQFRFANLEPALRHLLGA